MHFQTPTGGRGAGTADLLVGGEKGTGVGGVAVDVVTPVTSNPDNVIGRVAQKADQADHVMVNLKHTEVQPSQLGNILERLKDWSASYPLVENIKSVRTMK